MRVGWSGKTWRRECLSCMLIEGYFSVVLGLISPHTLVPGPIGNMREVFQRSMEFQSLRGLQSTLCNSPSPALTLPRFSSEENEAPKIM